MLVPGSGGDDVVSHDPAVTMQHMQCGGGILFALRHVRTRSEV